MLKVYSITTMPSNLACRISYDQLGLTGSCQIPFDSGNVSAIAGSLVGSWSIFFLTRARTKVSPNATATVHDENSIRPKMKALFIGHVVSVVVVSTPSSTSVITMNSPSSEVDEYVMQPSSVVPSHE